MCNGHHAARLGRRAGEISPGPGIDGHDRDSAVDELEVATATAEDARLEAERANRAKSGLPLALGSRAASRANEASELLGLLRERRDRHRLIVELARRLGEERRDLTV